LHLSRGSASHKLLDEYRQRQGTKDGSRGEGQPEHNIHSQHSKKQTDELPKGFAEVFGGDAIRVVRWWTERYGKVAKDHIEESLQKS
jgi:hypothetical protein